MNDRHGAGSLLCVVIMFAVLMVGGLLLALLPGCDGSKPRVYESMTSTEGRRIPVEAVSQAEIAVQLRRIADALDRAYPKPEEKPR